MGFRHSCTATTAALGMSCAAWAAPVEWELPSCVSGSPPLRMAGAGERAALDAGDRQRFEAAAQALYPLYRRGGRLPEQVLLIRRGGRWQYVTLWPVQPKGLCFSAVFAAERFEETAGWLAKYRPRAPDSDD